MSYFRELPNFEYQSPFASSTGASEYVIVKNVFRRMKLRDDLKNVFTLFNKRFIEEGERPDTVAEIVRAMKVFSHPGSEGKTSVDLNEALRGTATVSRSEWKNLADIIFELDQELPAVECFASELNQVFLNVVVNAAHAIEEKNQGKGTITVKTYTKNDKVCVSIEDTGSGVPEEIRDSIFDPFFTTKEVGKGTGQGLSVAYNIITQRHAGKIDFKSTVGEGTTFVIELPRNSNAQV